MFSATKSQGFVFALCAVLLVSAGCGGTSTGTTELTPNPALEFDGFGGDTGFDAEMVLGDCFAEDIFLQVFKDGSQPFNMPPETYACSQVCEVAKALCEDSAFGSIEEIYAPGSVSFLLATAIENACAQAEAEGTFPPGERCLKNFQEECRAEAFVQ